MRGTRTQESLFLIIKNRKWGFIDRKGQLVIKPKFNYALPFSDGRAAFKASNGKWGFIDRKGLVVVKPQFDDVSYFYEQRASVKIGTKWGFIDPNGNLIIRPQFDIVSRFLEGRVAVRADWQWRFIDLNGQFITKTAFAWVDDFSEGLAAFILRTDNQHKKGFIDRNGQIVIELQNVRLDSLGTQFTNGLAPVYTFSNFSWIQEIFTGSKQQVWGYIDKKGQEVISLKYNSVSPFFSECLAYVKIKGKYGVINTLGEMVIEPKFDDIGLFSEGLARVKVAQKYGYIDRTGQMVIQPQFYDAASDFSEGLAAVQMEKGGKWGYINKSGNMVSQPQFEHFIAFNNGLAKVTFGDKWGYIDRTGKWIWSPTK